MVNAAQAMDGPGKVTVSAKAVNGHVRVTVADTGKGMSEETRRRLFTAFFTTKPPGEGTGLGLSISKRIVESAGGAIEFESAEGKGSAFTVQLPVA
jgi:signal transduction histidine kinase